MKSDKELEQLCAQMSVFPTQLLKELLERIDRFGKKVLNIQEAAEYMSCSPAYVRQLANNGQLAKCKPVFTDADGKKRGRTAKVFFLRDDLDEFLTRNRIPSRFETGELRTGAQEAEDA